MKKKLMSVVLACAVMAGLAFSTSASAYWHHGWGGGWHGGYGGWHHGWGGGGVRVYFWPRILWTLLRWLQWSLL